MTRLRIVLVAVIAALTAVGIAVAVPGGNFSVHAKGAFEVPVRDTGAQGQATFKLSKDGESLSYKLNVANIENVIMAHIHQGIPGVNGDIVVWTFTYAPPDWRSSTRSESSAPASGPTRSSAVIVPEAIRPLILPPPAGASTPGTVLG